MATKTSARKSSPKSRKAARAAKSPAYTPEERALADRYGRKFRAGSLTTPGVTPGYGTKRTIILVCDCGAERTVATSDVFQVRACVACTEVARKAARQAKKSA